MTALHDALEDVAEQAKAYDVVDRVMHVARRRRRLYGLAPLAVAAMVATALVAVALPWQVWTASRPAQQLPSVGGLPARLTLPAQDPPRLPEGKRVGRGVLVSVPDVSDVPGGRVPTLLTEDGRFYRLSQLLQTLNGVVIPGPTLSPDGRWLGELTIDGYQLRDLTGSQRRRLPNGHSPLGWSPDGRWLLVTDWAVHPSVMRLDVESGGLLSVHVDEPGRWVPLAVLTSGEVLLGAVSQNAVGNSTFDARALDPTTGRERAPIHRDLSKYLGPGQEIAPQTVVMSPDGTTAVMAVTQGREIHTPSMSAFKGDASGLLGIGLSTKDVRRWTLPHRAPSLLPSPTASPGKTRDSGLSSEVVAYLPEGVLVFTDNHGQQTLDLLDPDTGTLHTITQLPGHSTRSIVVRGST
jgi:hypothetical protein